MKGYRFYAEYTSNAAKRRRDPATNVVALELTNNRPCWLEPWRYKSIRFPSTATCIAAVLSEPNSPVAGTAVSREHLQKKCRRVSERAARQIHPAMFAWLDSFDADGN